MLNGKKLVLIGLMVLGVAVWGVSTEAKDSNAGEKEKEVRKIKVCSRRDSNPSHWLERPE